GPVALIEINGQIGSCPGEPGEANDSVSTAAPGVDCCLPGATCICADQPVPRDPCNTAECGRHCGAYRRDKSTAGSPGARSRRQGDLEQHQDGCQWNRHRRKP